VCLILEQKRSVDLLDTDVAVLRAAIGFEQIALWSDTNFAVRICRLCHGKSPDNFGPAGVVCLSGGIARLSDKEARMIKSFIKLVALGAFLMLLITPQVFAMGAGGGGGGAGAGGAGAGAGGAGAGAGGTDPSSGAYSHSLSFYPNRLGTTKTIHKGKKAHQQRSF
jgi:hypothetical protein